MCMSVYRYVHECRQLRGLEEGVRSSGDGVTGACELLITRVGNGKQSWGPLPEQPTLLELELQEL